MFVDPSVADYEALVAAAKPGVQVVLLDASRDGVQQITDFLAGLKDVQAVYLVSHGAQGDLHLAASDLSAASLQNYAAQLSAWQASLSEQADILIYGCDVAQGSSGAALVSSLARLTSADVAASTDATGNAAAGGNWTLEYQSGPIEAKSAFAADALTGFMGVLDLPATPTITATSISNLTTPEDTALNLAGKLSVDLAEVSVNMEAVVTVTVGGKVSTGTGSDIVLDTSLAAQGNAADINAFLSTLRFVPNANWSGTVTITLTVERSYLVRNDNDISTQTFNVVVSPVADAPVGSNATLTTVEDTAITLTPDNFGFSDPSDTPANALSAVKITTLPTQGSLQLSGGAVSAGQEVSVTDIANGDLIYTPSQDGRSIDPGHYATLTFQVKDDGSTGVVLDPTPRTLTFDVTPVNDAPVTADFALSVNKNGSLSGINLTAHASDPDGGTSSSIDAAITSYKVLAVPDAAAGLLKNGATTLAAGATLTLSEAANLTFVPTTNYIGSASFTFQAIDAAAAVSNTGTVSITVAGVNVAPVLTVPGAQTVAEDASLTLASAITLADSDAGTAVVQATLSAAHGNITLTDLTGLTVTAGTNASHSVTVQGTLDAINAALGSSKLSYAPDHDYPNSTSSATDTITVVASDLGNTGGAAQTATRTITVTVTPVADAPVSAALGSPPTLAAVLEDATNPSGATVADLLAGKFSDVDGNTLAGVAVSANTAVAATQGEWQYSADGGASWTAVGVVDSSHALLLNSAAMLRFVPYANYNGTPGTLTLQAIDNSGSPVRTYTSNVSVRTLDVSVAATDLDPSGALLGTSVTPVDDASVLAADSQTVTEDHAATGNVLTGVGSPVVVADSDIDSTLSVASFTVAGDATVYLAGTTATISGKGSLSIAADGSYTFTPVANWNGSAPVVTYTLNTGSSSTLTLSVTPVNDTPVLYVPLDTWPGTGTQLSATVEVGSTLTFTASNGAVAANNIGVIDPDNTDAQLTFRLESLPTRGVLTYNNKPVGVGSVFTYASVKSGALKFSDSGGSTDGSSSFTVSLRDGAGGVVSATTVSLVVGGHNYAPNGIGTLTGTIWEDPTSYGAASNNDGKLISAYSGYAFSDTNVADASAKGYAIVANSANAGTQGVWQYSTDSGATWSAIGSVNDTSGALVLSTSTLVRFNPVANYNGTPSALSIRVLDSTYVGSFSASGASESRVTLDVSSKGGTTAISNTANTLTVQVQAVNDDPTLVSAATLSNSILVVSDPLTWTGNRVTISGTLTSGLLSATDIDTPAVGYSASSMAGRLIYTVSATPTQGWLLRSGYILSVGSTFSQDDCCRRPKTDQLKA